LSRQGGDGDVYPPWSAGLNEATGGYLFPPRLEVLLTDAMVCFLLDLVERWAED
jgi:hypothetical protein